MQISSKLFAARLIAAPTRSTSSATFASSLYTGMTTDTCKGALCGSTSQSSRRGRVAGGKRARAECRSDDMHRVAEHRRRTLDIDYLLQAMYPQRAEERQVHECPQQLQPAAPQRQKERKGDHRVAEHRDVGPQPVAARRAEPIQREEDRAVGGERPDEHERDRRSRGQPP